MKVLAGTRRTAQRHQPALNQSWSVIAGRGKGTRKTRAKQVDDRRSDDSGQIRVVGAHWSEMQFKADEI